MLPKVKFLSLHILQNFSITRLILLYDLVTCISIEFLYFSSQIYPSHLLKGFVSSITSHITISLGGSWNISLTLNIRPLLSTNLFVGHLTKHCIHLSPILHISQFTSISSKKHQIPFHLVFHPQKCHPHGH